MNEFQEFSGKIELLESVGDKENVMTHWFCDTQYSTEKTGSLVVWRRNKLIHRGKDLPAIILTQGFEIQEWIKLGQRHRKERPAVECFSEEGNRSCLEELQDFHENNGLKDLCYYYCGLEQWWERGRLQRL